eukprot:1791362-Amphidinium_carterae.1
MRAMRPIQSLPISYRRGCRRLENSATERTNTSTPGPFGPVSKPGLETVNCGSDWSEAARLAAEDFGLQLL